MQILRRWIVQIGADNVHSFADLRFPCPAEGRIGNSMVDLTGFLRVLVAALPSLRGLLRKRVVGEAEELLVTAYLKSEGHFQRWELAGERWIRIQSKGFRKDFLWEDDRARTARCYEAFERLVDDGYIDLVYGELYTLTGSGFQKANKLSRNWVDDSERSDESHH